MGRYGFQVFPVFVASLGPKTKPPFSQMRSEGSRFTLGSGGDRQKLRLRPQPFATVGNRPRDRRKALHSGECCRKGSRKWVRRTCDIAVISAFAEEVSEWSVAPQFFFGVCRGGVVWVTCGAAVILAFAEEVPVWVNCVSTQWYCSWIPMRRWIGTKIAKQQQKVRNSITFDWGFGHHWKFVCVPQVKTAEGRQKNWRKGVSMEAPFASSSGAVCCRVLGWRRRGAQARLVDTEWTPKKRKSMEAHVESCPQPVCCMAIGFLNCSLALLYSCSFASVHPARVNIVHWVAEAPKAQKIPPLAERISDPEALLSIGSVDIIWKLSVLHRERQPSGLEALQSKESPRRLILHPEPVLFLVWRWSFWNCSLVLQVFSCSTVHLQPELL